MNDARPDTCLRCGEALTPRGGAAPMFCPRCGWPVRLPAMSPADSDHDAARVPAPHGPAQMSAVAILSLVASSVGFVPLCFPMGLIGIALGVWARGRIALSYGRLRGKEISNAGIVTGIAATIIWIVYRWVL